MAKKKFVVGCFDTEDTLFPAVKKVRTAGYKIKDVYSPFAVHGLDGALGLCKVSGNIGTHFLIQNIKILV